MAACPNLNSLDLSKCHDVNGDLQDLARCKHLQHLVLRGTEGITGTLRPLRDLDLRTLVMVDMPRSRSMMSDFSNFFKYAKPATTLKERAKGEASKKVAKKKGDERPNTAVAKFAHCPVATFEDLSFHPNLDVLEIWDELSGGQCKVLGAISDWLGLKPSMNSATRSKATPSTTRKSSAAPTRALVGEEEAQAATLQQQEASSEAVTTQCKEGDGGTCLMLDVIKAHIRPLVLYVV